MSEKPTLMQGTLMEELQRMTTDDEVFQDSRPPEDGNTYDKNSENTNNEAKINDLSQDLSVGSDSLDAMTISGRSIEGAKSISKDERRAARARDLPRQLPNIRPMPHILTRDKGIER